MSRIHVVEVMTAHVVSIRPTATLAQTGQVMRKHHVSALPVTDERGTLVGIVSEGDLVGSARRSVRRPGLVARMLGSGSARRAVADVMSTDLLTTTPREDVRWAARRMFRSGVNHLPVVHEGQLVGIVSRHDMIGIFDRAPGALEHAVVTCLGDNLFAEPDARIRVRADDGVVTLEGQVRHESDVRIAGALAAGVDGTLTVDNRLGFDHPDARVSSWHPVFHVNR